MSTNDTTLKLRLSRLLWKMGYFVRRNVPVSTYTPGEYTTKRVDITDIDVLGSIWDEDLRPDRIVCECKSGGRAKPLDRCFWIRGVMHFFEAKKGYLIVKEGGIIPASVGHRMGVTVIDQKNLSDLEKRYDIDMDKWIGYCSPGLDNKIFEYKKTLKEAFRRQLNYLIYGYWKDPEYYQLKRLVTIGREISSKFSSTSDASKWFSLESLCLLTSSLVTFCQKLYLTESSRIYDETSTQLLGGLISKIEREGIAESAVKFFESYIESQYGDKSPLKSEQIDLNPDYMEKLVELISRLVNRPHEARLLPSFMDVVCFEFLFKGKTLTKDELHSYSEHNDVFLMAKLAKNVVGFYLDSTKIKTTIFEPLINF